MWGNRGFPTARWLPKFVTGSNAQLAANSPLVGLVDVAHASQAALALRRLLLKDVAEVGVTALEATTSCHLDALGEATVGLHLRHVSSSPVWGFLWPWWALVMRSLLSRPD